MSVTQQNQNSASASIEHSAKERSMMCDSLCGHTPAMMSAGSEDEEYKEQVKHVLTVDDSTVVPLIMGEADPESPTWKNLIELSKEHSYITLTTGETTRDAVHIACHKALKLGEAIAIFKEKCNHFIFRVLSEVDMETLVSQLTSRIIRIAASGVGGGGRNGSGGGKNKKKKKMQDQIRGAPLSKLLSALTIGHLGPKRNNPGKKPGNSRRPASAGGGIMGHTYLGPEKAACVKKYALAVADPFNPLAIGACNINAESAGETLKTSTRLFSQMVANLAGNAFCLISPTVTNDTPFLWITDAGMVNSNTVVLSANDTLSAGWYAVANKAGPFSFADLDQYQVGSPNCLGRLVSVGVRFRYAGREDAMSGRVYYGTTNRHQSVAVDNDSLNPNTASNIRTTEGMKSVEVSREWTEFALFGQTRNEHDFPHSTTTSTAHAIYPYSRGFGELNAGRTYEYASSHYAGAPIAVIAAVGMSDATTLEVELVIHAEYTGNQVNFGTTPSDVENSVGSSVAAAGMKANNNQDKQGVNYTRAFRMALKAAAPHLLKFISGATA